MARMMDRIKEELAIRLLPKNLAYRKDALYSKFLADLQVKGENCTIENPIDFQRRKTVALGSNVTLKGKGSIDGQGGVFIGSGSTIGKNVTIETESRKGAKRYDPVLINRNTQVLDNSFIEPGTILGNIDLNQGLLTYAGEVVFIVGTGRSGTKSIAQFINNDSNSICYHDPFAEMNVWSCDKLYKRDSSEVIIDKMRVLYSLLDAKVNGLVGQSDQKFGALITELNQVFPNAKFIWLIRDAASFINSAYPRGWFRNCEFGYCNQEKEFFPAESKPFPVHAEHRTNGFKVGAYTQSEWMELTAFERLCWYWSYWNGIIEEQLESIPTERKMMLRLSDINNKKSEISSFLGIDINTSSVKKVNAAKYKKLTKSDWTEEMNRIYIQHCSEAMNNWFNES